MAHEEYKEMLPALALSALDAEDQRALDQHLAECDECRRELADWENTASALALSVPPAEPSAQVRDRIMRAVSAENEKQPRQESSAASPVIEFPQGRRARWTAFGRVGAIAAAVLFLVLIIWILVLWQENRALRQRQDQLYAELKYLQEDSRVSRELVTILTTPGAKVATLSGTGPGAGANAKLVYNPGGRAMLLANDLPPIPEGKEYQLWFIVGGNPYPGKTFSPDDLRRGELSDDVPRQARDSAVFALTVEPAGGSLSPTSEIYLRSGL
jgi:anti-sigma-K factor RskA